MADPRRWNHPDNDRVRGGPRVPPAESGHRAVAPLRPEHPPLRRQRQQRLHLERGDGRVSDQLPGDDDNDDDDSDDNDDDHLLAAGAGAQRLLELGRLRGPLHLQGQEDPQSRPQVMMIMMIVMIMMIMISGTGT